MYVVMVAPRHRPWGNRIIREARALRDAGHEVVAVMRAAAPVEPRLTYIGVGGERSRLGFVFRLLPLAFRLWRLRGDVYHCHNPYSIPLLMMLALAGKRVVYDTHEDYSRRLMMRGWIPRGLRPLACSLTTALERLASRVSAATFVTQAGQVSRFGPRTYLLRNAPVLPEPKAGASAERISDGPNKYELLYAGSLTRARGVVNLLNALEILVDRGLPVRLSLLGPDDDGVVSECRDHPAWGYVDYAGLVGHEVVLERMAEADLGIVVLQDVGDHADAYPSKLFEYMACGLPFVASDFPRWREFVGNEAGCWVEPEDAFALADTITGILQDPDRRRAMSLAGRAFIEEFNWDRENQVLLAVYQRLAQDQSRVDGRSD